MKKHVSRFTEYRNLLDLEMMGYEMKFKKAAEDGTKIKESEIDYYEELLAKWDITERWQCFFEDSRKGRI